MEIREELLKEIYSEGKRIYERTYVDDLENNTKMMREFVRKNPNEGSKLVHFKSGFDARKEQQSKNNKLKKQQVIKNYQIICYVQI